LPSACWLKKARPSVLRDLQADYPDRIELYEFEDAGFTVLLSHTEEVVSLMSNIVNDIDRRLTRVL